MIEFEESDLVLKSAPLAALTLRMASPFRVCGSPAKSRIVVEFTDAEWEGERLRARRKGVAAVDWLTIRPDGKGCLEVRFLLETHDGAVIYVDGPGCNDPSEFFSGNPSHLSLCFETEDHRYTWLNHVQAIAKGRLQPDEQTMLFQVYELL